MFKNTEKTTIPAILTPEQAQFIADVADEFGFFHDPSSAYHEHEKNYFIECLLRRDSYHFGIFEYCARHEGVRIHVTLSGGQRVNSARLSRDGEWTPHSEEAVEAANARLAAVL